MSHIRNNMIPPKSTKNIAASTSKKRKQQSVKPPDNLITDYGKLFLNNMNQIAPYQDPKSLYKFINNESLKKTMKKKKNEIEQ